MKQEVLLSNVLPYIQVWTLTIISILLVLTYRIWRFGKQHPEIFQQNTAIRDKQKLLQKAELQRQYHNKSMLAISVIFVWIIGMAVICFGFERALLLIQGWFLLVFAACCILWVVSLIKRKP
ncbi:MAG: hypothetical protein IJ660_05505 [Alphaproteobacteria bacterium]|nr:hypothetical protein [Alphaproteobacteria bacterium]